MLTRAKLDKFLGELNYVYDCKVIDCDTMLSVYQGPTNNVPNDVIENFDYIESRYLKSINKVYIWCLRKVESNHD